MDEIEERLMTNEAVERVSRVDGCCYPMTHGDGCHIVMNVEVTTAAECIREEEQLSQAIRDDMNIEEEDLLDERTARITCQ
jgi:hypothetical protein